MTKTTRAAALMFALVATAASAQIGSDSYRFLEAVRKADAATANGFISASGPTVIDTKDRSTGESAMHIVVARRDIGWMALLMSKNARLDQRDKTGRTPLFLASELGFAEGAELLLSRRAKVDEPNNSGETPLIRAVQRRDIRMTRLLLEAGANPDKQDTLAGQSARDYATGDPRSAAVLRLIEQTKKNAAKPSYGP